MGRISQSSEHVYGDDHSFFSNNQVHAYCQSPLAPHQFMNIPLSACITWPINLSLFYTIYSLPYFYSSSWICRICSLCRACACDVFFVSVLLHLYTFQLKHYLLTKAISIILSKAAKLSVHFFRSQILFCHFYITYVIRKFLLLFIIYFHCYK